MVGTFNRTTTWIVAIFAVFSVTTPVSSLEYREGPLRLKLDVKGSAQIAWFDSPDNRGNRSDDVYEWTIRGSAEYAFDNGILLGVRLEYDDDFDVASDEDVEDKVERDEFYAYLSSPWGRLEVGEQDGPADTMSFHAPIIGLGQVRGNFARFQGTRALISPVDTQDSFKVIYLSPPFKGLRGGVSYGPKLSRNTDEANPRRRTIQRDHVELALQYQNDFGPIVFGLSGAYVTGESDPITEREDLESWSIGTEVSWQKWTFGGAFVERGDSNTRLGRDQSEWNYGISWRQREEWGLGLSGATSTSSVRDNQLVGAGGFYQLFDGKVTLKADVVYFKEDFPSGSQRDGVVGLTEIEFSF